MSIATFIQSMVAPVAKQALFSLGIGTVTYVGSTAALNGALAAAKASMQGMTPEVAQILAMAGLFEAMAITAGALTSSMAFKAMKSFQLKTS
jgi:Protein of unknown function (DUF2523)